MSEAISIDYNHFWDTLSDFIKLHPGARHRRRLVLALLKPLQFSSVLDVGCGPADLLRELRRARGDGFSYTGADIGEPIVRQNQIVFPLDTFLSLDIQNAALPQQYDLLLCCEVIEHLAKQKEAIGNLLRMTKPGGHLLVTVPTGKRFATEEYFGHLHHPTLAELQSWGEAHGARLERAWVWGWPWYLLLKYATNLNAQKSLAAFAEGQYSWPKKAFCEVLYYLNFLNLRNAPWGCQIFALFSRVP